MTDINNKILEMIKQDKSISDISSVLNLTYKQIFNRINQIKDYGYFINKTYDTNANIYYLLGNGGSYRNDCFSLENKNTKIKIMVISDLHIGNFFSAEHDLNSIYNYCIKNNIHTIIICGDMLDGIFSKLPPTVKAEEQIERFLKFYPFDKSIINLYTLGDHDTSLLGKSISFKTAMDRKRHDITSLSTSHKNSETNVLTINNQKILVTHKTDNYDDNDIKDVKLHLIGHKHISKNIIDVSGKNISTPKIFVPSFSYLDSYDEINIPRAVELTIYTDRFFNFQSILKKDLMLYENKIINTNNTLFNYNKSNPKADNNILYKEKQKDNSVINNEDNFAKLNEEQQKYVDDFFGRNQKKLTKELKNQLYKKY